MKIVGDEIIGTTYTYLITIDIPDGVNYVAYEVDVHNGNVIDKRQNHSKSSICSNKLTNEQRMEISELIYEYDYN